MTIGYYCAIFPFCGGGKKKDDKKTKAFYDWATTGIPVKNKEENTVTYQQSPPWLLTMFKTPALKLFCTQSSHGLTGKKTYPAEPWTLEIIGYY